MPYFPNKLCSICKQLKGRANAPANRELYKRINRCKRFLPGGEAMAEIARDIGVDVKAMANHVKKHQAPAERKLNEQIKAHETKEALREIQTEGSAKTVAVLSNQAEMRKELLQKGMEAFEKGDIKMGMSHIVTMLGQEQKAEEAAKDRGLEVMKMFKYFNAQAGNPEEYKKYTDPIEGEVVDDRPTD